MHSIFAPAISLMKNLKYSHKFTLICIIFLLPMSAMLFFFLTDMEENIAFIEKEKLGIEYNLHLKNLLDQFQQHRGMTNAYLSGDESFAADIYEKKSQIARIIKEIDMVDKKIGFELKTGQKWTEIKEMWANLQTNANQLSVNETFNEHTAMIEKLVLLMDHIGNTSNLALDTKLKNYHLIESYMKIPMMTEKIGQTRGYGAGLVAKKTMTVEEKTNLFVLSILIESTIEEIDYAVNVVLSENVTNKSLINAYLDETVSDTQSFLDTLYKNVLEPEEINISSNYYFLLASKAIDSAFTLYEMEAQVLNTLLEHDIEQIESHRNQVILLLTAVLVLIIYLFIAFYRSVRDTVLIMEQTATKMANGDLKARVALDTKDELHQVGDSFNLMAEALYDKIDELKQAEELLLEQKEFSDNLILNSTTAIFVINAKGNITIWNKACEELTGVKASAVLGTPKHWKAFYKNSHPCLAELIINENNKPLYSLRYAQSQLIPDGLHSEGWFILGDGMNHYLSFDAAPIYNRKGELTAVIETLMDMTEKKRTEDKIKYKAYHDTLTQLPNRSYLNKAIGKALLHAKEETRMVALLFIDLDGFKEVNDTHGHDIGDEILKIVAARLQKCIGDFDTVARLGGDEFVILLQEINKPSDAGMFAINVIKEINLPIVVGHNEMSIGASIGISLFPNNGVDNETLTKHADLAMYQAKKNGKNKFQFYTSLMCEPNCKLKSCIIKNMRNQTRQTRGRF